MSTTYPRYERKCAKIDGARAFLDRKSFDKHNIISDGVVIYSYGSHFPMARHLADGSIAVNADKYSMTTSHHQSALRGELVRAGYEETAETADIHNRWAFRVWRKAGQ